MDNSGAGGNVAVGAILAADPPLGHFVSVTNPQALAGGTFTTSPALSQVDILSAEAAIIEALEQVFITQTPAVLPDQAHVDQG